MELYILQPVDLHDFFFSYTYQVFKVPDFL
jgi:hypothetical protein